jgi:hypothetical protein
VVAAFSGKVSTTSFTIGDMIDRAFGRCKVAPQQVTDEYIAIARQMLYLHLSTLGNEGVPLWCKKREIYPIYEAVIQVPLNPGVIDILGANLRTSTRITGVPTTSEGDPLAAFDSNLKTACTQTLPEGWIQFQTSGPTNPPIYGFMPNVSAVWDFVIQGSNDGLFWENIYVGDQVEIDAGEWFWTDVEGVPQTGYSFFRLQAMNDTILDVCEFVVENRPSEIPVAKLNMDDYANLPDKYFLGRPVQFFYDKSVPNPEMFVWPAPQLQFTFNQFIVVVNRYIEDVGDDLTLEVEVPQRWKLAIMTELARNLAMEIPEVKPEVMAFLGPEADMQLKRAWASESDGSPTYLKANIRCYTR